MKPKTLHVFGSRFFLNLGAYCHTPLLIAFLFFPSLAFAIDSGGAIFQHRWYSLYEESSANGASTGKTFVYDAQASLEMWQNLYGYGQLRGLAEWYDVNGENRLNRGYIELRDYPLYRDILLTLRLGDNDLLYSPLIEPLVSYRGGTLVLNNPQGSLLVFGGQTRKTQGVSGLASPYADQMVIGMRAKYNWQPLTLGIGVLGVEGSQRETEPREKTTVTLTADGEWRIKPWLKLLAEGDLSFYDLANDGKGYQRDYALLFGPVVRYGATPTRPAILNLEILYKRLGPFSTSVSENVNSDKEGIFINGDYQPFRFINFFGGFQGYREDLDRRKDIVAAQDVQGRAGMRIIGGIGWPTLIVSYDFIQRRSVENTSAPLFTEFSIYNAEVNQNIWGWRWSLRYQRTDLKDLINSAESNRRDVFYADLRKMWSRYFDTYFSGQYLRQFDNKDFITQRYYYGRAGMMYRIFSLGDLRLEAAYSRTYNYSQGSPDSIEDKGEALGGLVIYLPWQTNFNLEYVFRRIFEHTGKVSATSTTQNQINFYLTKRFAWGEPVVTRGVAVPGLAPGMALPWGTLYGYIFVDVNGNQRMDPGEAGLGGMRITLEDGTMVTTDSQGYYEIPRIVIGKHKVALELRRLPANYDTISPTRQEVEIKQQEKSRVDFAVGSLGTIMGRVIEDANQNGRADEGEEGLSGIGIILERNGDKKTAYSDAAGDFLFDNILGGTYKLYLDKETLPAAGKITSPEVLTVNLPAGGEVKNLRFLIYIKPRTVIKTFTGNGNGAPHPVPLAPQPPSAPKMMPPKSRPSPAPSPPLPQTKGKYIIHLASFKTQKRAEELAASLEKMGYKVKVVRVDLGEKGVWYRMIMDGYTSKEEAQRTAEKLRQEKMGLSPRVIIGGQ